MLCRRLHVLPLYPAFVCVATPPHFNVNNSIASGTLGLTYADLCVPLSYPSGAIGNTVPTRHALAMPRRRKKMIMALRV